jgi:three-Cys-motif partner protein
MKESHFFEKQTASSKIKASIVSEYFPSYCKIIVRRHEPKQLRYIDLFAGPGYYNDGNPSTPILIARRCKDDDFLRKKVKLIFNDNTYSSELERNFFNEFPSGTFQMRPFFANKTVGEYQKITNFLVQNTHEGNHNEYPSILEIKLVYFHKRTVCP